LEIVGERWALLIVRDLLVGAKRFTDLHRGLPGIATNVLTARLQELEQAGVVQRRALPRPGEVVTPDSIVMALRTTFRPESARRLRRSFELRLGDVVVHARIRDGTLDAAPGPLPGADLVIEAGPQLRALLARDVTPAQALASGIVRIAGDAASLDRFADVFRI
jgi:hypothetical protein